MPLSINIEVFRQHYVDVMNCRGEISDCSAFLGEVEQLHNRLLHVVNTFGRETVNKVVANAVCHSTTAYDDGIKHWVDTTPVRQFFFETDDVLKRYIPENVGTDLLSMLASDLILQDKNKNTITSTEGLQLELLKNYDQAAFLSYTNEEKQTIYLISKRYISTSAALTFSAEQDVKEMFLRYQDGLGKYNQYLQYMNMRKLLSDKLYGEIQDFKAAMLSKDSSEICDNAYMISKLQNFHIVIDNMPITSDQIEQLMARKTVLQDLCSMSIASNESDDESLIERYLDDYIFASEDEEELEV